MCFWPCHNSCGSGPSGKYAKRPWHMGKMQKKKRLQWSTYGEAIENKQLKPSTYSRFFSPPDISNVEDLKSLQTLQRDLTLTIACKETYMRVEITKTKVVCQHILTAWLLCRASHPANCTKWYIDKPHLIDLPLRLPIIKWFIPDVYLSPVLKTPEFFSLLPEDIVQNPNIMCKDKPLALGFIIWVI